MRELDVLLAGWLERHYENAGDERKAAFRALLELPDPELAGYLLRGEPAPSPVAAGLIAQIRGDDPA